MKFTLQQPGTEKLLEALDAAAKNADSGGGVFAFASKGGIDALFSRPNILYMLKHKRPFHLIVGVDAITNAEALLCLSDKVDQFNGILSANVFFHEYRNSTFHPKFSWFIKGSLLKLLTGSGNLTRGGLGKTPIGGNLFGNWEAFSLQIFKSKFLTVKKQIDHWLDEQRKLGTLCTLSDERVRQMAMSNGRSRFSRAAKVGSKKLIAVPIDGIEFETPEILVRELSSNRLGQADVGKLALKEFFGYVEGEKKKIFIQYVSLDNELGPVVEDHLFVNASRNFRLELRAIVDFGYEIAKDDSRMILVATKLDHCSFRYTILPVTAQDYRQVEALLGPINHGNRRMREARVTPDNLLSTWKEAPDNLLPIKLATPEI
jgi:hypothetical protein